MKNVRPPKKLSEAIMLALNDLALVEADPRYKVDMGTWHKTGSTQCHVCFAGSVMARSFNLNPSSNVEFLDFPEEWRRVFRALNCIRQGDVDIAIDHFYLFKVSGIEWASFFLDFNKNNLSYEDDPIEFKNAMCDVAMMLESLGL